MRSSYYANNSNTIKVYKYFYDSIKFHAFYELVDMVFRCSVEGCKSEGSGITLFKIPFENDSRSEAIERRQVWIDFVVSSKKWAADWQPTKSTRVCCQHFNDEDFERRFDMLGSYNIKKLRTDHVGVAARPTLLSKEVVRQAMSPTSRRKVRNISICG